jgi:RND family efflux transporter MFP subunit
MKLTSTIFSKVWLTLPFIIAFIMALLAGCGAEQVPRPDLPEGQLVRTLVLSEPDRGPQAQFPGRVEAHEKVQLAFQVAGVLEELPAKEGLQVEKGDLLARLDPRDYENALKAKQADAEEAKKQFDRFATLLKSKTVSEAQYEEAQARYEVAQALIAQAQKDLEDTYLRAPFAGVVAQVYMENFQNIKPKQPILLLEKVDPLDIVIRLPEQDMTRLPAGKSLLGDEVGMVTFEALPDRRFPVTVKAYETRADPQTQTYLVTLTLPAPKDALILPGMTATFVPSGRYGERRMVFTLPVTAVVASPEGKSYVWVVNKDTLTVARREVTMGNLIGDGVLVLGDLAPGDRIVTQGAPYLEEGDKIQPQDRQVES